MKDLFLIPIMLATFVFGYYVVAKFGDFIEENQRLIAKENRDGRCHIHIASENPILLDSISSALESCSEATPHIEFFLSCGKRKHLLDKLLNERIDPCEEQEHYITSLGLPVENTDKEKWIRVVWKKSLKSQNRDRVIATLEMEQYRLKCGYADYLE